MTHTTEFLYFFLKTIYFEILLQTIFNYINNKIVEYKINKIFDKKFK